MAVEFLGNKQLPETTIVYLTTEANSYGAGTGIWNDGIVHPLTLKPSVSNKIAISKVTAYEYIKSTCSEEPFYQGISAKLKSSLACKELSEDPCSDIALPTSKDFVDLPSCGIKAKWCYRRELERILKNVSHPNQGTKKTCHTQEYEVAENQTPPKLSP